jgi:hypothetical protein
MNVTKHQGNTLSAVIRLVLITTLLIPVLATADEERFPKFSIRFAGEAGIMAIGDINKALKLFNNNETLEYIRKYNPSGAQVQGSVRSLNDYFVNWEPELRIDLSRRVGIGISISGAIHKQNESSLTYVYYPGDSSVWPYHYYFRPEINVKVPIKLTLYYYWLQRPRFLVYGDAGVGYYTGNMSEQLNFDDVNGYSGDVDWTKRHWETQSRSSLGIHIGMGAEILLMRNLALTGEIQWRNARIGNFRATNRYETGYPFYEVSSGYLWYLTRDELSIGGRVGDLIVSEVNPAELYSVYLYADVHKAVFDISGLSIKIGLRLRLF